MANHPYRPTFKRQPGLPALDWPSCNRCGGRAASERSPLCLSCFQEVWSMEAAAKANERKEASRTR